MENPWSRNPRPEFIKGVGWVRNGHRVRIDKPHYNLIWPRDHHNGTRRSRWKDLLTGRGPDIFLSITASPAAQPVPRARWSRWTQFDPLLDDASLPPLWPAARYRRPGKVYDFRSRTYRYPRAYSWSDVDAERGMVRDVWGHWGVPDAHGWVEGF
ncbi:hypothetical protein P152DRAFT_473492 [Eremomyces bilateralis CBS 781.70]|uniref:Uncharacterized protein n=1 Tax=Eremomyces bilateralis CBS 781.70 TaxID=1392243 RepID=A0A6G1G567_9PEZI|nr:uncharacterized protein P152DRAFT_473492 [Eremomyces bilateralis CBS 781.70]KAF1812969.1 hypothetical protein P152DRAFT_473492 [Eremomyces bilateralis CBS 781.70]